MLSKIDLSCHTNMWCGLLCICKWHKWEIPMEYTVYMHISIHIIFASIHFPVVTLINIFCMIDTNLTSSHKLFYESLAPALI